MGFSMACLLGILSVVSLYAGNIWIGCSLGLFWTILIWLLFNCCYQLVVGFWNLHSAKLVTVF